MKNHAALLAISITLSIIGSALSLAQPFLVSTIVTDLGRSVSIAPTLALLLALVGTAAIVSGFQNYSLLLLGEGVVRDVRRSLTHKVFSLSFTDLRRFSKTDLLSRATTDTAVMKTALTQSTTQLVGGSIMFVGALIAMAFVSLPLLAVTLGVVVVSLAGLLGMSAPLRRASLSAQESVSQVANAMEKYLRALKTVRSLNAQERVVDDVDQKITAAWRTGIRFARISAMITPISGIVLQIALAAVLGFGGFQVSTGAMTVAQLIAFIMYLFMLLAPIGQAIAATTSLSQALSAITRVQQVEKLDNTEPIHAPENPPAVVTSDPRSAPSRPNVIEFEAVSFAYPRPQDGRDQPRNALTNVSLAIPNGAKVGIVGASGAGKSTLLGLISRFYDPDDGTITVNGAATSEIPRNVLRANIGLVEQDAPVIAGTLRENLTLGNATTSTNDCLDVLDRVNLTYLLTRENGLDLALADEGANLSGGERQRLAIARILLANRTIVLLDESTSQMDSDNEMMLRHAIDTAAQGRTLIVVAHRLSTIIDSDVIFVLRDGQLDDSGTHDQLLRSNETYWRFARQQKLALPGDPVGKRVA